MEDLTWVCIKNMCIAWSYNCRIIPHDDTIYLQITKYMTVSIKFHKTQRNYFSSMFYKRRHQQRTRQWLIRFARLLECLPISSPKIRLSVNLWPRGSYPGSSFIGPTSQGRWILNMIWSHHNISRPNYAQEERERERCRGLSVSHGHFKRGGA
jgi:hypothetical protein